MYLDSRFGPAIRPQQPFPGARACEEWERSFAPATLRALGASTAGELRDFMDKVALGAEPPTFLSRDMVILWLVDLAGTVLWAVEELVLDGQPAGVPRHKRMETLRGTPKLGHPALVGCEPARIGGEIFYDFARDTPAWVINNSSGRYGLHRSRTLDHLRNVADSFRRYGIELEIEFTS